MLTLRSQYAYIPSPGVHCLRDLADRRLLRSRRPFSTSCIVASIMKARHDLAADLPNLLFTPIAGRTD